MRRLIESGHAYAAGGDVYFDVRSWPQYGELSGQRLDHMIAAGDTDAEESKRDPRDFALWKGVKPGEPFWETPWGPWRPGWHLECSAMSTKYLGATFDIHGGGLDLLFPHHENEQAQSRAAGDRFAAGQLLVFRPGDNLSVTAAATARVVLVGGAAMDGPRHVWWNFVSSRKERIEQAKAEWKERRFDIVPGDDSEFIPLPE